MRLPVPEHVPPARELGHVHLVGIGGAALSGIARILLARGHRVSGSDAQDSPTLQALRDLGATCHVGHDAGHVLGADTVVVSTAVRVDNPEVQSASAAGALLLPRSAAVQSLLVGYRAVAVAGTHGKTTTTSLLAVSLLAAGADPSYAIGADLSASGSNARHGASDLFVVEADESDGAFLTYTPQAAVVTNVDADHLDVWETPKAYANAFSDFLGRIRADGFGVFCVDDPGAALLAGEARDRGITTVTVALDAPADLVGADVVVGPEGSRMTVVRDADPMGELTVALPGRHYLLDALGALAVGLRLGFGFDDLTSGMAAYSGTRRRMESKGEAAGVRVVDSYAHHPVEIAADLDGARALAGNGRLVVCFQPHLVSRTRVFGARMGKALGAADVVVVADIYVAREDPEEGVSGRLVADAVPLPADRVIYQPRFDELPDTLAQLARPGDLVVTLGAGDVTAVGPLLLERLSEARP